MTYDKLSAEHCAAVARVLEAVRGVRSPAHAVLVLEDAGVACMLGVSWGLSLDATIDMARAALPPIEEGGEL